MWVGLKMVQIPQLGYNLISVDRDHDAQQWVWGIRFAPYRLYPCFRHTNVRPNTFVVNKLGGTEVGIQEKNIVQYE